MTKSFALSCVLLAITIGASRADVPRPQFVKDWQTQCRIESGVSDQAWSNALDFKVLDYNDRALQCYTSCMWKKHGAYRQDGSIDMGIVISHVPEDKRYIFEGPLILCESITQHEDLCTRSMLIYKCLQETQGENFQFV